MDAETIGSIVEGAVTGAAGLINAVMKPANQTPEQAKKAVGNIARGLDVVAKPVAIREHKSFASKPTGTTTRPNNPEIISEVSETVKRMQKLAGIIK
jgi:hypothetical protein